MNEIARATLEHLQRAGFNLKRNALVESLAAFCTGMRLLLERRANILGQDKLQLQAHIAQYLLDLSRRDDIKEYFYARKVYSAEHLAKFKPGKEEDFYLKVKAIHDDLAGAQPQAEEAPSSRPNLSMKDLHDQGLALMAEGNHAKGKVLLRKVAEASAKDPAVTGDIADLFIQHGLLLEAMSLCQRILELNPANPRMYSAAITASLAQKDFDTAEKWFIAAGKRFGMHPRTHLRMAKMYLDWRKWEQAFDHAKYAAGTPETAEEAREILAAAEKRMM